MPIMVSTMSPNMCKLSPRSIQARKGERGMVEGVFQHPAKSSLQRKVERYNRVHVVRANGQYISTDDFAKAPVSRRSDPRDPPEEVAGLPDLGWKGCLSMISHTWCTRSPGSGGTPPGESGTRSSGGTWRRWESGVRWCEPRPPAQKGTCQAAQCALRLPGVAG